MNEGYLADTRVTDEEQLEEIVVLACVHCEKVVKGMYGSVTGLGTAKSEGESSGCVNTTAVHVAGRNRPISDVRPALSGYLQHKGNTNCFYPFPKLFVLFVSCAFKLSADHLMTIFHASSSLHAQGLITTLTNSVYPV